MSENKKVILSSTMGYIDVFPRRIMWTQIAEEFNGKFTISLTSGNVIEIHRMNIPYKKWEIKISESDTRPLKFEIEFNSLIDFELVLGREDFIEKLLKKIGKKEIEIGGERFDNQFLIQSDNPLFAKQILSPEIRDTLLNLDLYSISYSTDAKMKKSNLITVINRTIDEKNTLWELVKLHQKIIDNLESVFAIG